MTSALRFVLNLVLNLVRKRLDIDSPALIECDAINLMSNATNHQISGVSFTSLLIFTDDTQHKSA